MKAIILPTISTSDLAPLTSWSPESLLPVVNKPVVEHLIELLARHQFKEILLILKHMPYETEAYFGDGSRWGVHLSYSLLGNYRGISDALGHLDASKLEEPFLCLPADLITDLNITEFVKFYQQGEGGACLAIEAGSGPGQEKLQQAVTEGLSEMDLCPLIMTGETFKSLTKIIDPVVNPTVPDKPGRELDSVKTYQAPFSCQRIKSLADLVTANRRVLEGDFKNILIPGKHTQSRTED